ncbi:hypothetical protein SAMN02745724_03924 [Pseudoalteromonas denitrificans DSM 6059]|uniref:Transmembrane protein n=1 Tax=Pseudoalteromonas denitrificans DSM 6059 TaxID=1123010 RepID=A0A1I1QLE9_9GAMM|nr:hypothetical protein SAMN02745724_03924 [Pseudoalteromonas denitrificans DSM 6059]
MDLLIQFLLYRTFISYWNLYSVFTLLNFHLLLESLFRFITFLNFNLYGLIHSAFPHCTQNLSLYFPYKLASVLFYYVLRQGLIYLLINILQLIYTKLINFFINFTLITFNNIDLSLIKNL